MPIGEFKSIYAVSSEDTTHPASNLLKIQPEKKWKCREVGEKSAYVILELDKSRHITGIDVGNEHSSFVSVFVGRKSYTKEEFKEILITSSLMTPIESKNSTMTNRVRCFSSNSLVESVAQEKWELVMAVCTQPFNRHVQYGLSFLTVHVAKGQEPEPMSGSSKLLHWKPLSTKPAHTAFGESFHLCEDSSSSDNEIGLNLFERWKLSRKHPISVEIKAASQTTGLLTNIGAIKPAKLQPNVASSGSGGNKKVLTKILDRNRDDLLFREEDNLPDEHFEKKISADKERLKKEKDKCQYKQKITADQPITGRISDFGSAISTLKESKCKPTSYEVNETTNSKEKYSKQLENSRKRQSSPLNDIDNSAVKIFKKDVEYKPFNRLLNGVVVVISGIQNPDRGVLRQKAIDLGARYKTDWGDGCTHLICAFKNTPKYNQVKKTGKIVTRHWIEKCHSLKKRLPWRRFALDEEEVEKPESEDEIHDISLKPHNMNNDFIKTDCTLESVMCSKTNLLNYQSQSDFTENEICNPFVPTGSDTEDEIERALTEKEIFEASTDEDETMQVPSGTSREPQLFDGLNFYLSDNLSTSELQKLGDYIKAFRGIILDDASSADYIVTYHKNELNSKLRGEFVSPQWVFECYDMECRIPTTRFLI